MTLTETYSYDDVLLVPGYADFLPHEASITTRLGGNIRLNAPIISAAMDTVTEDRMAIALALEGGAGVIHRNLSPQAQADHVGRVKRYLNWVIENPVVIEKGSTVETVYKLMQQYGVSGLPVVEKGKLVGIVTGRDLRFCTDYTQLVDKIMTPNPVVEKAPVVVATAQDKFNTYKIEKLPVVDDEGRLTGLITVKDMEKHQMFPSAAVDEQGRLLVGAAVSPNDFDQRIPLLLQHRVDFVVLDTAHGDSVSVLKAVENIKKKYPSVVVVGGNVATREGTRRLVESGADTVKVGVGPGSICTTRIVAGIGMPQFTAVYDCADEASKHNIPVIADGGIKYSGDIVKAIGAGASVVMLGNLFAGVKEAPGREVIYEGRIFKEYRGMGSTGAIAGGSGDRYQMAKNAPIVPEGIEGRVPFKGELKPFLHQLTAGLKKGMGYCGCRTVDELRTYRKFVKITAAGLRESHAHDVQITQEAPNYSRS